MNNNCSKCGELFILSFMWSTEQHNNQIKSYKQYHCKNGHFLNVEEIKQFEDEEE